MRISKRQIRARCKSDLPLTFSDEKLSAHGGLELIRRYLGTIDFTARVQQALGGTEVDRDYGVTRMLRVLLGLLILGGFRVTHLAFVGTDPILLRFCDLHRLPNDRTVIRWLKAFTSERVEQLATLVRDLVYDQIEAHGWRRLTLDLDGTVLRTGAKVEGAERGFNPHHPKDPSYYPLTAHLAQLGQILRVWNRPGNVHDSHNAAGFLRGIVRELRERFGRLTLEIRMDGAFFVREILEFLDEERLEYAIKVPFWKWLGLREWIVGRRRWTRVDAYVDGFALDLEIPQWKRCEHVVIYRKRVSHESRKNFQLDLFDPADGHYEYSAVATTKAMGVVRLWHFMAGRGAHEKTLAEWKQHFGLETIPTQDRWANTAWQQISALALNLIRSFQIASGAAQRPSTWKRTYAYVFLSLKTLRFQLIHQPLRIVRPGNRPELRFAVSSLTQRRIQAIEQKIERAA